jgi:fatty acid desaturase
MRADTLYLKAMYRRHPVWFHQMLVELIVLWGLTATFLILDWKRTLLFWMLPHLYAQWGIITINYFQHDGCDGDSEFNHSRNFIDPFFNWWFFNNGFHAIHHDFPNLHWSATPEAYRNRYAGNIHPNLEESSMLKFLWRTFALNQRRRYDGSEWELPEEGPDEDWIPRPTETRNDLGAEPLEPQIW